LTFINQKGGVGKTTTTLNVGAGLAKLDKKVLLIDFDPQSNLTDGMGIDEEKLKFSIYDLLKGKAELNNIIIHKNNISILPSQILLTRAENEFKDLPRRDFMLDNVLKKIRDFDYILIDCPPSLGFFTINALTAASDVYIPLQPEYFALKGIRKLLDVINYVKKERNSELIVKGIIGTRFNSSKKHHKEVLNKIQKNLGDKLYYIIRENISLAEASSYGQSIFEYKPKSHGAEDYMSLSKEILNRDAM
ncbi:ParA family protein, partial [Candidatus Latescibacterota bacterium]